MRTNQSKLGIVLFLFSALRIGYKLTTIESAPTDQSQEARGLTVFDQQILQRASEMIKEGRQTFRFDTFGDEAFWGDTLRLHEANRSTSIERQFRDTRLSLEIDLTQPDC